MAWARIREDLDRGSRIAYFVFLFLYASRSINVDVHHIARRCDLCYPLFMLLTLLSSVSEVTVADAVVESISFSLAWWAYTFPTTGFAIATIKYSMEVTIVLTKLLFVGFSAISTFTVTALLISTIIAFVLHDLFPSDVSIAITHKRPRLSKFMATLRSSNYSRHEVAGGSVHGSALRCLYLHGKMLHLPTINAITAAKSEFYETRWKVSEQLNFGKLMQRNMMRADHCCWKLAASLFPNIKRKVKQ